MNIFHSLLSDSGDDVPQELLINQQIGIMIWGQSNAEGSTGGDVPATSPINYQLPILGVQQYINSTGEFNTLEYIVNAQGDEFNQNLSLGYGLYDAIGRPVFMGIVANGGTPLYNKVGTTNFSPDATGADRMIDDLEAAYLALIERCSAHGKIPYIISVWVGGETDSQTDVSADEIAINYQAITDYLVGQGVVIDSHIISILNQAYANATPTQIATVRSRLTNYIAVTENAYGVDMDQFPLQVDDIHFTGPGQQQMGEVSAGIILNEIFGLGIQVYPGGYSTVAKNALKNFRDDIDPGYAQAVADFVDGMDADGIWDNIVVIQLRGMENTGQAFVDLRGRKYGLYNTGTHTPGVGILYDGTEYSSTEFEAGVDGGTEYTLNNAGFGWYVVQNFNAPGLIARLGGSGTGTSKLTIYQGTNPQLVYGIHSTGLGQYAGESFFDDAFLYLARRTAASGAGSTALIKGSTVVDSDNVSSTAQPVREVWEGAANDAGTPVDFINAQIGLFVVFNPTGFNYAAFKSRVDTLIADLNAL